MATSLQNNASSPRILVVDDEPDVLDLLQVALTSMRPYEVALADSAATALDRIATATRAFDVFLLDIQMPRMGGIELLGEIRNMPGYARTPVIMLTAMGDRHYVDAAFRNGAHDYVTKPFDFDDLLDRIDAAFPPDTRAQHSGPSAADSDIRDVARIEGLLGRFEFENYLAQLSHGRLYDSHLLAVRMLGPETGPGGHAARSGDELLVSFARSIARATKGNNCLFCHIGDETFAVLFHGAGKPQCVLPPETLDRMFREEMREKSMALEYRSFVGQAVAMRDFAKWDMGRALRAAIEGLERRENCVIIRPQRDPKEPAAGSGVRRSRDTGIAAEISAPPNGHGHPRRN